MPLLSTIPTANKQRMITDVFAGYADLCEVHAKYGITAEKKAYWLEAACAFWLDDEDAVEDKLTAYYNNVVK